MTGGTVQPVEAGSDVTRDPRPAVAKHDFTVADVLAWARTRPADQEYCYTNTGHCAIAQFLKDTGRAKDPSVSPNGWEDRELHRRDRPEHTFCDGIEDAVCYFEFGLRANGRTFGALADRLASHVPAEPVTQSDWAAIDAYLTEAVEA